MQDNKYTKAVYPNYRRKNCKKITPEVKDRCIAAYKPGVTSCYQIAGFLGISQTSVRNILKEAGIDVKAAHVIWTPERDAELLRYCDEGLTPYMIGKKMQLDISQLRNRVSVLRHENQQRVIHFSEKAPQPPQGEL